MLENLKSMTLLNFLWTSLLLIQIFMAKQSMILPITNTKLVILLKVLKIVKEDYGIYTSQNIHSPSGTGIYITMQ